MISWVILEFKCRLLWSRNDPISPHSGIEVGVSGCPAAGSSSCKLSSYLHFGLYPGPNDVGLAGKLPTQVLVGLLLALLILQSMVPLWHQLLNL